MDWQVQVGLADASSGKIVGDFRCVAASDSSAC